MLDYYLQDYNLYHMGGSDSGVVTQFRREGTGTGFIANTSSATSYATSQSDRRAKKNF